MKTNTSKTNNYFINHRGRCLAIAAALAITGCHSKDSKVDVAPGAPGVASHWSYSGKTGIGTSYEVYTDQRFQDSGSTGKISKVWFSLAQGILTETMFGLIHEAQVQEMQFYVKGDSFLHQEKLDTISQIDYIDKDTQGRPLSLAYKILNRDKQNRYEIEKLYFTDPDTNSLMMKVTFRALSEKVTPYLYLNPNMANTGPNDKAWHEANSWYAADGKTHLALKTDATIVSSTVGFEGVSDGLQDLAAKGKLEHFYNSTGDDPGNVAITLELPTLEKGTTAEWQFVLGFGNNKEESELAADQTLNAGYESVLAKYNGTGDAIGWEDYLASLPELERLSTASTDGGKLLYTSALVLKAQEDKTHAGAVIASLSTPWGDTVSALKSETGYKAVWPRDFYQVTMAMLALGDKATPKVAFEYLQQVQAGPNLKDYSGTPGWFLQKTHVDGEIEWVGVQLDQTAMPIMLGWRLWKEGVFSDAEISQWYKKMLKPAAQFLAKGGDVNILWNKNTITPPLTQQERWEEQSGYSPSTTAAIISGLVAAADLATLSGSKEEADTYLEAADRYFGMIDATMFTTEGVLKNPPANGKYFLRISKNANPNDQEQLDERNGQVGLNESEILDAGFLELVRYGVRSPSDPAITETLPELDDQSLNDTLRVKYEFSFSGVEGTFPGWRRYGKDGYGEGINNGYAYTAAQMRPDTRGRVWPIFTGERGQYELAKALESGPISRATLNGMRYRYIKGMELFANEGRMIPEQVWDGVGSNDTYHYVLGKGTNSATPLAWSHAEYVKLLRSYTDQKIWDKNDSVAKHYTKPVR